MSVKYVVIVYDKEVETLENAKDFCEALVEELLEEFEGYTCVVGEVQEDGTIKTT